MKKPIKLISLNLVGLFVILLLFNFPTFQKVSVESAEPIMLEREHYATTRAYPETVEEMQRDIESGKAIRSIAPLKTLEETYAERGLEYPAAAGEELEEAPPEYGEPKNGDHAEYSEPVIVQVINALGDNITKIMAGLLTLSQILLNFRTFRNRKKVAT